MKYLKMLGLAALAAMALTAFTAGTASATTLEVGGTTQNASVNIAAKLATSTSTIILRTDGSLANTCVTSAFEAGTETFTGSTVTGTVDMISFFNCERTITVHKGGTLHVEHIAGGTNGTVSWSGWEFTVGSPFGTLNCKTGAGVDVGTLTGTGSGAAVLDASAVLNCGFLVPSTLWKGTYTVTGNGKALGVSA